MKKFNQWLWKEHGWYAVLILLVLFSPIFFGIVSRLTLSSHLEVVSNRYELIVHQDSYQTAGAIKGNIIYISGKTETEQVYRLYYLLDETTKEVGTKTLYADEATMFLDLEEGETPYLLENKKVRVYVSKKTGDIKFQNVIHPISYEIHLPKDAIIRDFELDAN